MGVVTNCSYDFSDVVVYFKWCFHFFCCVLGRNPPCILALSDSGGVGVDIHVCSMHRLRDLVISCSWFWASSHCVLVRCSFWSSCVRWSIARFCFSRKIVCRLWRLLAGMGYVIIGLCVGFIISLRTIVFGPNCNWAG